MCFLHKWSRSSSSSKISFCDEKDRWKHCFDPIFGKGEEDTVLLKLLNEHAYLVLAADVVSGIFQKVLIIGDPGLALARLMTNRLFHILPYNDWDGDTVVLIMVWRRCMKLHSRTDHWKVLCSSKKDQRSTKTPKIFSEVSSWLTRELQDDLITNLSRSVLTSSPRNVNNVLRRAPAILLRQMTPTKVKMTLDTWQSFVAHIIIRSKRDLLPTNDEIIRNRTAKHTPI